MNSADLDQVLSKLSPGDCVQFFKGASESDRKAVAVRALQWYEIADAYRVTGSPFVRAMVGFVGELPKRTQKAIELTKQVDAGKVDIPKAVKDEKAHQVARLAVTATAGLTDVRKVGLPDPPSAFAIMRDRKPKWLDKWLEMACEREPLDAWELVRQIENDGLAVCEKGSGYWVAMAESLGQLDGHDLIERLQSDKELLENHLWSMLDSPEAVRALSDPLSVNSDLRTPRFSEEIIDWQRMGARAEKWNRASYIWRLTLAEMAISRQVSRERLMGVVFEWMARLSTDGESKGSAGAIGRTSPVGWFQSLHDEMEVTPEERIEHIHKYIGLLSSKDSGALVWCLGTLGKCPLEKIRISDLTVNLSNVFVQKKKEPAVEALKLIEQIHKAELCDLTELAYTALQAFDHKSADIHKKALAFLKKSKAIEIPEISAGLKERLDSVGGLVRKDAAELVGSENETDSQESENIDTDAGEIVAAARQMSGPLADEAGILAALEAFERGDNIPPALTLNSSSLPKLNPEHKIVPLENIDDLIYLILHVLEGAASTDDYERALDGMTRLCHDRPRDFESRVSSLKKKIADRIGEFGATFGFRPFQGINALVDLCGVARAWIEGKVDQPGIFKPVLEALGIPSTTQMFYAGPMLFLSERTHGIARLVVKRTPLPLLSAPTHKGGWIDPLVLPERIKAWQSASVKLDKADFIQALLRLAPEHRTEALYLVPSGDSEFLNSLRYALGAELVGSPSPELWVAAFRCRSPRGLNEQLRNKHRELGPDSAVPAEYKENLKAFTDKNKGVFGTSFDHQASGMPIISSPEYSSRAAQKYFPTELLHCKTVHWDTSDAIELFWPQFRESYFYYHVRRVAGFLDSSGNYWKGSWDSLFDPDVSASGMASWLIALGLSAKQTEAARLALDALIATIDDDRLDGPTFGIVLGKLLPTGHMTLSRWITGLKDVARISPVHRNFVLRTIEYCLGTIPTDDMKSAPISMLELLYECLSASGEIITLESARNYLQKVGGKGKGAKLAKLILEMPDNKYQAHRKSVALQMLRGRVQRVQRWQSWQKPADRPAALAKV